MPQVVPKRRQGTPAGDPTRGGGLTQDEVAELFGVSRARIQQIELRAIAKIRAAFQRDAQARGLSVGRLLFGDDA